MSDVVRRLVIPRARASAPAHVVDAVVDGVFQLLVRWFTDYENKDRVLAAEPAVYLLARLGALLFAFEVAYALLLWPLVRFRSPQPLSSWLVGLLAVMDSAAMLLALRPSQDRIEPRLAIRMGFVALREIGAALGISYDPDPDPNGNIVLAFAEFAAAVDQLRTVGFPIERSSAKTAHSANTSAQRS